MSRLRAAIEAQDLGAAVNRLSLHGDLIELQLLTDPQWALYLDSCGHETQAKEIIAAVVNRTILGGTNGPQP